MLRRAFLGAAAAAGIERLNTRSAWSACRPAHDAPGSVDLLLVLAADVSASMNEAELRLQQAGYRAALVDPAVLAAVGRGRHGAIGVAYVEWAGPGLQECSVPWTRIAGPADAVAWGAGLVSPNPRLAADAMLGGSDAYASTAISHGLAFAARTMAQAPWTAPRRVIDISGDGVDNNAGIPAVEAARDRAVRAGITINGLVIEGDPAVETTLGRGARLADYYRAHVIGGPNAFVIEASGMAAFPAAIQRKLAREIAEAAGAPSLPT